MTTETTKITRLFVHSEPVPIVNSVDGNSGAQGFIGIDVDSLDLVCYNTAGLDYRFEFAKDLSSGRLINPATSKWEGMMGEVIGEVSNKS